MRVITLKIPPELCDRVDAALVTAGLTSTYSRTVDGRDIYTVQDIPRFIAQEKHEDV